MLQFKPARDVALLNAMMHVIVDEKLYDRAVHPGFTSTASSRP
jgi:formate dehydrogenase major subunit